MQLALRAPRNDKVVRLQSSFIFQTRAFSLHPREFMRQVEIAAQPEKFIVLNDDTARTHLGCTGPPTDELSIDKDLTISGPDLSALRPGKVVRENVTVTVGKALVRSLRRICMNIE